MQDVRMRSNIQDQKQRTVPSAEGNPRTFKITKSLGRIKDSLRYHISAMNGRVRSLEDRSFETDGTARDHSHADLSVKMPLAGTRPDVINPVFTGTKDQKVQDTRLDGSEKLSSPCGGVVVGKRIAMCQQGKEHRFFLIPLAGLGISKKSAQKSTISILAPFVINSSLIPPNIYRLSLSPITPNLDLHSNPNSFLEFGIWLFLCRGDLRPVDDGWLLGTLWLSI
ncbi:hypothetical protein V8G54_020924 [Vigna mungo]|uniref:Uncharacterized protein n=1 Tax=Vigna mungo TaxID=3915 RepID=A0AAQ3RWE0_VIGMU